MKKSVEKCRRRYSKTNRRFEFPSSEAENESTRRFVDFGGSPGPGGKWKIIDWRFEMDKCPQKTVIRSKRLNRGDCEDVFVTDSVVIADLVIKFST